MLSRIILIAIILTCITGCSALRVLKTNAHIHPNDPEAQANAAEAKALRGFPVSSSGVMDIGIGLLSAFVPAAGAIAVAMKRKDDAVDLAKKVAMQDPGDAQETLIKSHVKV